MLLTLKTPLPFIYLVLGIIQRPVIIAADLFKPAILAPTTKLSSKPYSEPHCSVVINVYHNLLETCINLIKGPVNLPLFWLISIGCCNAACIGCLAGRKYTPFSIR